MKTWQIAAGIGVIIFIVAPIIGVIFGRQAAKRKQSASGALFTIKQRILFAASLVIGAALITTGLLLPKKDPADMAMQGQQEGQVEEADENNSTAGAKGSAEGDMGTEGATKSFEFSTQNGGGAIILD